MNAFMSPYHSPDMENHDKTLSCTSPCCSVAGFHDIYTVLFVGCMWLEYGELLTAHGVGGGAFVVTGNGLAFLAGRVSYAFGFTGPCVPTNTGANV